MAEKKKRNMYSGVGKTTANRVEPNSQSARSNTDQTYAMRLKKKAKAKVVKGGG